VIAAAADQLAAVSDPAIVARVLTLIGRHLAPRGRQRQDGPRGLHAISSQELDP
jgi:hypothetical protein